MTLLAPAIVLISSALVAYTLGVWAEHRAGDLRGSHLALFSAGLVCDASGTWLMSRIADSGASLGETGVVGLLGTLMAVTGAAALVLMAAHVVWASLVLLRGDATARRRFHRLSTTVWAIWLVPYVTGMGAAMLAPSAA